MIGRKIRLVRLRSAESVYMTKQCLVCRRGLNLWAKTNGALACGFGSIVSIMERFERFEIEFRWESFT